MKHAPSWSVFEFILFFPGTWWGALPGTQAWEGAASTGGILGPWDCSVHNSQGKCLVVLQLPALHRCLPAQRSFWSSWARHVHTDMYRCIYTRTCLSPPLCHTQPVWRGRRCLGTQTSLLQLQGVWMTASDIRMWLPPEEGRRRRRRQCFWSKYAPRVCTAAKSQHSCYCCSDRGC